MKGINKMKLSISIRKTFQGAYVLSTIVNDGYLFEKQYMGYTKRECIERFKKSIKEETLLNNF